MKPKSSSNHGHSKSTKRQDGKGKAVLDKSKLNSNSISLVPVLTTANDAIESLETVGQRISDVATGYRKRVHDALAEICVVARFFEENADAWQDFCRHQRWENFKGTRPRIEDRSEVLQPCVRFGVGFAPKDAKTVSKYFAALSVPYLEGTPSSEVAAYLDREGGIEALARKETIRRRGGNASKTDPTKARLSASKNEALLKIQALPAGTLVSAKLKIMGLDSDGNVEIEFLRLKPKDLPKTTKE